MHRPHLHKIVTGLAIGIMAFVLVYLILKHDWPLVGEGALISENTPAGPFLLMMGILPIFGFPISVFLVFSGIKFGFWTGLVISGVFYPLHLLVSYGLANSVVRKRLATVLEKRGYELPRLPKRRSILFGSVFVGVPGIPYAVKNYLLAMAGMPLRYYLPVCWPIHIVTGAPFIYLGKSAVNLDIWSGAIAVLVLVGLYALMTRLGEKYDILNESD